MSTSKFLEVKVTENYYITDDFRKKFARQQQKYKNRGKICSASVPFLGKENGCEKTGTAQSENHFPICCSPGSVMLLSESYSVQSFFRPFSSALSFTSMMLIAYPPAVTAFRLSFVLLVTMPFRMVYDCGLVL